MTFLVPRLQTKPPTASLGPQSTAPGMARDHPLSIEKNAKKDHYSNSLMPPRRISMAKRHLRPVSSATVNRTVDPGGGPMATCGRVSTSPRLRSSGYECGQRKPGGHRDATMILWPTATACALPNSWTCAGIRSSSERLTCTSGGQTGYSQHPSNPRRRIARPAAVTAGTGAEVGIRIHVGAWGAVQPCRFARMIERAGLGQNSPLRHIRTCCAMRAGISLRMTATTPAPCKPISATRIFSTRCAIPS